MKPFWAVIGLGSLAAAVPLAATAEQWFVQPKAQVRPFYEDNVRLTPSGGTNSSGVILRAAASAGRLTETTEASIDAAAVRREYFDATDLSSTDFFGRGLYSHQIERDRFTIDAELDLDSTLTSEVGTSGLVDRQVPRSRWYLAPKWEHYLSERTVVDLNASFQQVDYDDGFRYGLVDYDYGTLGAGLAHGLSETTQLVGRLSYDDYRGDQVDSQSNTIGMLVGAVHAVSERLTVTTLGGWRRSETELRVPGVTLRDTSNGFVFDLGIENKLETGTLAAGIGRSLTPASTGGMLVTDRLTVDWDRRLSGTWDLKLGVVAYRNERPSGQASSNDRDFLSIAPSIGYRWDRRWRLEAGYRYRYQKYDNDPDDAQAHAVFVAVTYADLVER